MLVFLVKRLLWALFFVSSLCAVNVLMLLNAVLLLPFSPIRYRKINEMFTHVLWPYWSYGIEYLAGNRLHFYGEKVSGQENVFLLANHTYWCDWIIAFAFATRFNRVGVVKVMVKELIRWIPGVGTGLMGCGCIFLSRHWPADRPAFIRACSPLLHHPLPFWLFSHPEGSRVTPKKLLESQAFAAERGLPKLNNVLLPRIKGFHTTVQTLGDKIDAIYDITIAYSKKPPGPITILCGPSNLDVHVYVMRIPMKDVPRGEKEVAQWLYELFEKKDKLMDHWKKHGVFPGPEQALPYDRSPCERAFFTWTPVMVATLVGTGLVTQRLWRLAMQRLGY